MKTIWGLEVYEGRNKWVYQEYYGLHIISAQDLRLQATLASANITHINLWLICRQLSCIMGNAGGRFLQVRKMQKKKKKDNVSDAAAAFGGT